MESCREDTDTPSFKQSHLIVMSGAEKRGIEEMFLEGGVVGVGVLKVALSVIVEAGQGTYVADSSDDDLVDANGNNCRGDNDSCVVGEANVVDL